MPSTNQTKQSRRRARAGQNSGKLAPQRNSTVTAPYAQNRSSQRKRGYNSNSTRYKECERIGTVIGSVAFATVLDIPCNPALPGSFPWLAGHASLYEKYRVHSVTYRYKNLKGTSTDGNIIMSFDYDTLDSPPTDAITQSQSTVWIDGAPWRIFEMKVPSIGQTLFTRTGDVSGADLKTYDLGRLFISAEGCSDTSAHGYLEVEYDIECFDKQKSNIVAAFRNMGNNENFSLYDFPLQAVKGIALLDVIFDGAAIPYDPYTGTFKPVAGYYRIDRGPILAEGSLNAPLIGMYISIDDGVTWSDWKGFRPDYTLTLFDGNTSIRFYTGVDTIGTLCITKLFVTGGTI